MPDLNPMDPGDVPYPQYSVTTTERISDMLQITKGIVYTKDATGRLIVVATTLANGIYQAKATPLLAAVAVDDDEVQVLGTAERLDVSLWPFTKSSFRKLNSNKWHGVGLEA